MKFASSAVPVFRFLFLLSLGLPVAARDCPSGFANDPAPSERALAAMPVPNQWFREMAGDWHGPRGLEPLRERWAGFAAANPAYAVLAALVSEAEGDPERALAELRALSGDFARWNEGRLLAILGRLNEAESTFAALVPGSARPDIAAAAVLALTELDCIRGDFAAAEARAAAAWEIRREDDFRVRLVERRMSLLVAQHREGPFLESLTGAAFSPAEESERGSARLMLARLTPWFRNDPRVAAAQREAAEQPAAALTLWNSLSGNPLSRYWWFEKLNPSPRTLDRIARGAAAPFELAGPPREVTVSPEWWPARLEDIPSLKTLLAEAPLTVCARLFENMDPAQPPPALLLQAAAEARPEAARLALELVARAWSGAAGPDDIGTLTRILVAAPGAGGLREPSDKRAQIVDINGWPAFRGCPSAEVVWNFRGADWAAHYQLSCRLAPLRFNTAVPSLTGEESVAAPLGWAEWRPRFPREGAAELTRWAWGELRARGEATPERFHAVLQQLAAPADRIRLAVECGHGELLSRWCGDAEFVRRLPSASISLAAHALTRVPLEGPPPPRAAETPALGRLLTEMAARLEISPADLARVHGGFRGAVPEPPRKGPEEDEPPVNRALAGVLGHLSPPLENQRAAWEETRADALPHPLWGLPVCPSLDRLILIKPFLETPPPAEDPHASPFVFAAHLLGEGNGDFMSSAMPVRRLQAIAAFATAHPLKRQLARWAELSADLPKAMVFSRGESWKAVKKSWRGALRTMAGEEKTHHPWEVLAAELEEDPGRREAAMAALRHSGPFHAGLFTPASLEGAPVEPRPPTAAPAEETPVDAAIREFRRMLETPDSRKALEPAGAGEGLLRQDPPSFFVAAWRRISSEQQGDFAQRLLAMRDPLAARMAVAVSTLWPIPSNGKTAGKVREEWIGKALALFPDDPELLLARATEIPENHGFSWFARTAGTLGNGNAVSEALFQSALSKLTAVAESRQRGADPAWCGSDSFVTRRRWSDPKSLQAIAEFAERARPLALPLTWVESLETAFSSPETAASLPSMQAAALALARHRPPFPPIQRTDRFQWNQVLDALLAADNHKAAAAVAEVLLGKARGPVTNVGRNDSHSAPQALPPWENPQPDQPVDGWRWLQLAKGEDPAGLADRLEALRAAATGDEQLSMAALMARAMARPLTEKDTRRIFDLPHESGLRVLALASGLLPPDLLPPALCLEAWEWSARASLSSGESSNITSALESMERLRRAGAEEAARRLLPPLLECVAKWEWFPEHLARRIMTLVDGADNEDASRRLREIRARHLKNRKGDDREPQVLADMMDTFDDSGAMPPELITRVEAVLGGPAADGWDAWKGKRLAPLAVAAALHPRFHDAVRALLKSLPAAPKPDAEQWGALITLFQALDRGPVVPDVALRFDAEKPGAGTLRWHFQGILLPRVVDYFTRNAIHPVEPAWAPLAARLADGAFDAAVLTEGQDMVAPVEIGNVSAMGASGSIPLSGLKALGRFRLRLTGKAGANPPAGESRTVGYNSLPPLADSGGAQAVVSKSPPGWRLLTEPVALTDARHWHVEAPEAELPRGLSVVLLDDAGKVFAATPELGRDAVVRVKAFEDYRGALVAQEELPLWVPPMGNRGAPGPPHLTGGPRKLALAFPADWQNLETTPSGAQFTVSATATPPRLTVRPWPAPLPEEGAGSAKLEVVRSWGRSEEPDAVPVIGLHPLRAAWISQGKIRVWDLEGERAEPSRVLTVEAELPAEHSIRSLTWQGDQLHVFSTMPRNESRDSTTVMITVKPYEPESRPVTREFPGMVNARRPAWPETADLPLFNVVSEGGGTLRGILTADGRLLELPSSATEPMAVRDVKGASLSFHDSTGKLRALDWSDGTPRIRDIEPATTPGADLAAKPDSPGAVMLYPEIRAAFAPLPVQIPSLTVLGEGRYLGRGMNSEAVSFVLLRKTPADK